MINTQSRHRQETGFFVGAVTTAVLVTVGSVWFDVLGQSLMTPELFVWVFGVMIWCAFGSSATRRVLAELLGEPYGTLILTLSLITIEVVLIAAIMLIGDRNPVLARDTMLAVVVIVLNGIVGAAFLIDGLRHREQTLNLQGARTFLAELIPLATMSLVLPRFTKSTVDPTLTTLQDVMFATITIALYPTFLAVRTSRHHEYFLQPPSTDAQADDPQKPPHHAVHSVAYHAVLLVLTMLPIAPPVEESGAAGRFRHRLAGGILVAVLVLSPEGMAGIHAALANQVQRAVNICIGSALATIGLTVPAVLVIGQTVLLGLDEAEMVLLLLTLLLSALTFGVIRTNMLQGAVHLVIFAVYIVLIFSPCASGAFASQPATLISSLPKLLPSSRPMKAAGAFSSPSTTSSR